jgi:ATP-dependent RNA helicase RhlE
LSFSDYPFEEKLLSDITAAGYESETPIQEECIATAIEGLDLIGVAPTGTGKTAAFVLPMIHRLHNSQEMCGLVLAPTRELAQQIASVIRQLGQSSGMRVATIFGGVSIDEDYRALKCWPNVLVATPGRLIDHITSGTIFLRDIKILVIDEADRMHDMGFIPQVRRILSELPDDRQTLLFTATLPNDVEQIARGQMRSPKRVQVGRAAPAEGARQRILRMQEEDKIPYLLGILRESAGRVLVFVRTKRGANRVARVAMNRVDGVAYLHSDRIQSDRDEAMHGFRNGKYRILIATDIAARGLDVADIEHVINFDFPQSTEDYIHRVGRTARVAATGEATSFVTPTDQRLVEQLKRVLKKDMPAPEDTESGSAPPRQQNGERPGRRRSSRSRRRSGGKSVAASGKSSPEAELS